MFGYHMTTRMTPSRILMCRWLSIVIFLTLLLTLPRQAFSTIYGVVTDQGIISGNVVIVDLEKKTVVGTVPVGLNPKGIVIGGPGYAYVANSSPISNSVSVIEIAIPESSVIETITGIVSPHHLILHLL